MRELKFRLWGKCAQQMISWLEVRLKPHVVFDTISYDAMQFTGLVDKDGNDIYEGDIIESKDSNGNSIRHHVSYDESQACFCSCFIPVNKFNPSCGINQQWVDDFDKRVIGNIYENPELLA